MEFIQDSFEEYLSNKEYLSSSGLKQLMKTPRHYMAYLEQTEPEEKEHLVMGSALHCLILEEAEFYKRHFVWLDSMKPEIDKDYKTKVNREARETAKKIAMLKGQALLSEVQLNDLLQMKKSIEANQKAMELLHGTKSEVSCYTELDGFKVKVRPDALHDEYYISLKTTRDASPTSFSRMAYNLGYHISEGLYSTILNRPGFIIAVENVSPFIAQVYYTHDPDTGKPLPWIEAGLHSMNMGLLRLKEYQETGEVKGYDLFSDRPDGMLPMTMPAWAEYQTNNIII